MKYTIEDLSKGKCAVKNDGTLDELKEVLSRAFPKDKCNVAGRGGIRYSASNSLNGDWMPDLISTLPTQSVKDFLTEEVEYKVGDYVELLEDGCGYCEGDIGKVIRKKDVECIVNVPNRQSISYHEPNVAYIINNIKPSTKEAYDKQHNISKSLDVSELVEGEIYHLEDGTFKCIFICKGVEKNTGYIRHSGCYIYSSSIKPRYSNLCSLTINSDVKLRLATPNEKEIFIAKSRENNNPIKLNSEGDSNIFSSNEMVEGEIYYVLCNSGRDYIFKYRKDEDELHLFQKNYDLNNKIISVREACITSNSQVKLLRKATLHEVELFKKKEEEYLNKGQGTLPHDNTVRHVGQGVLPQFIDTVRRQRESKIDLGAVRGQGILSQMSDRVEPFSLIEENANKWGNLNIEVRNKNLCGIDLAYEPKSKSKLIKTSKIKTFNR